MSYGLCASCGAKLPYHKLDTKPSNSRYRHEIETLGAYVALNNALDRNDNFDRLECEKCYGPCFVEDIDMDKP